MLKSLAKNHQLLKCFLSSYFGNIIMAIAKLVIFAYLCSLSLLSKLFIPFKNYTLCLCKFLCFSLQFPQLNCYYSFSLTVVKFLACLVRFLLVKIAFFSKLSFIANESFKHVLFSLKLFFLPTIKSYIVFLMWMRHCKRGSRGAARAAKSLRWSVQ